MTAQLTKLLPPSDKSFPEVVDLYLAHPESAKFLLTLANLEMRAGEISLRSDGADDQGKTFMKLAETLLLFHDQLAVKNASDEARAATLRKAYQHYIINTDGPIPVRQGDDSFNVFQWAAEYAANFSIGLKETVDSNGKSLTLMTIDDPANPVRCEEWGRVAGWSSAWSLRQVGHLINHRRFGRFDVIPVSLFPFEASINAHHKFNAMWLAYFSQLVYLKQGYVAAELKSLGFDSVDWIEDNGTDTQAFVASRPGYTVVSFRGTREAKDFLTDLKIRKKTLNVEGLSPRQAGKVHRGFLEAGDSVWEKVLAAVNATGDNRPVFVTGHSLGAALAQLTALRLAGSGKKVAAVYTYGSPRVGNSDFRKAYDKVLLQRTFRYVNNKDIVTTIPIKWLGFLHVAQPGRRFDEGHRLFDTDTDQEIGDPPAGVDPAAANRKRMAKAAEVIDENNRYLAIDDLTTLSSGITYEATQEAGRIDDHGISQYLFKIACAIIDEKMTELID